MSSEAFHIIPHEFWICFSTLSQQHGDEITKLVTVINEFVNKTLKICSDGDLNKSYVPEQKDRDNIVHLALNSTVETLWNSITETFSYEEKGKMYKTIGYFVLRLRFVPGSIKLDQLKPNYVQQIVFLIWNKMMAQFKEQFIFDDKTPPYLFSVATKYVPSTPRLEWTKELIETHKEDLGQWAEIYTGSFPDYREEVYRNRVNVDLSNRKSEVHLINRNSALFILNPENYDAYFIKDKDTPKSTGYLYDSTIKTVIRIRTIQFVMHIVNKEIDEDTVNLATASYLNKEPEKIKRDLEKTNRLKNTLQILLAPVWIDIARSHRQHYAAVLNRAVELCNIQVTWRTISDNINANAQGLQAIFLDKQEASNEQQEGMLNTVNLILGASILFEVVGYLVPAYKDIINQWLSVGLLVFLAGLLLRLVINKRKKRKSEKSP